MNITPTYDMTNIPTNAKYPCTSCERNPYCARNLDCNKWLCWFAEAWKLVTNTIKRRR